MILMSEKQYQEKLLTDVVAYAIEKNSEVKQQLRTVLGYRHRENQRIFRVFDTSVTVDFPRLVELTEGAVDMFCNELTRLDQYQEAYFGDFKNAKAHLKGIDVKTVLQDADTELYDDLVTLCW